MQEQDFRNFLNGILTQLVEHKRITTFEANGIFMEFGELASKFKQQAKPEPLKAAENG